MPTWAELFAGGRAPEAISEVLARGDGEPLALRILAGFGAWLTALFLIGLLAAAEALDGAAGCFLLGGLLVVAGVALSRRADTPFPSQLALAVLVAGDGTLTVGAAQASDHDELSWMLVTQLVVTAIAYLPSRSQAFRFLAPMYAIVLATVLAEDVGALASVHAVTALLALLVAGLHLVGERPRQLDPLANAAALGMAVSLTISGFWRSPDFGGRTAVAMWPSGMLVAALLIATLTRIVGGPARLRAPAPLLGVAATAGLGAFTHPGVLVAAALLVLGLWHGERLLRVLGLLYLPVALVVYYRELAVDLATKGWIVLGSGVLLLLLRPLLAIAARRSVAG